MPRSSTNTGTPENPAVEPSDPQVEPQGSEAAEPTATLGKRKKWDESDPIPESKWLDAPPERPYAEAMTPEHREFLRGTGKQV